MKSKEKLIWIVGIATAVLLGAGVLVCTLYWLTGLARQEGARWWAVVATLTVPLVGASTWRVATHSAREHVSGIERGMDVSQRAVEGMGRSLSATASLARSARQEAITAAKSAHAAVENNGDDLLPRMRLVEPHAMSRQVIDV